MKKYELTGEIKTFNGRTLHRIKALRDFGDAHTVKAGDLGGWLESERNLSQERNAWVCGNAAVYDDARIEGDAIVADDAEVFGDACICDNARVIWDAKVYGEAVVGDDACVVGHAEVYGHAKIRGHAIVSNDARVRGHASVEGYAKIGANTKVYDYARVFGYADVYGLTVEIYGDSKVHGEAYVYGGTKAHGDAELCGNVKVFDGDWEVSPLYIQGSRYPFNVASDLHVRIGCEIQAWETWHNKYREIAKKHTAEDIIVEYVQYFNLACRRYGHEDCLIELE